MKKNQIFACALFMGIALGACTEDYTDWANPQSNSPEDPASKYEISFATGADATVDMDQFYESVAEELQATDSVVIASLSSTNPNVASIKLNSININGLAINATVRDGNVKVNTLELDSVVRDAFFSRAHVERVFDVNMNVAAKLKSGEAVNVSGTSQAKLTPISTPAISEGGYVLLGDFTGWDPANPMAMTPVANKEGVYQVTVETTNEAVSYFKFYAAYDVNGGWDVANAVQMGCRVNGDTKTENFVVWTGDKYKVETPAIAGAGHFIITLDVVNYTYTVAPATAYLYMAGEVNGWKHVDMLASLEFNNIYTGYMYLNQNGFKFSSEPNWDGTNYGADFSTAPDADNIMITEPEGFYQVVVDLNEKTYTLTPIAIGIIGSATPSGWDSDTDMTYSIENRCWTITTDLTDGEIKFRANDDWTISWGGTPEQLTTQNGGNIAVTAGKYTINLYPLCEGKAYCTIEAAN